MFLNCLNLEEKKMFLELAFYVANVDGDFAETEHDMMNIYRSEMMLGESEYKIQNTNITKILEFFENSSTKIQHFVFVEIIGIVLADEKYDNAERKIVSTLKEKFSILDEEEQKIISAVGELKKAYKTIGAFVNA